MNARELLLSEFHRLAEVPDAVPRLRSFVLDLAVRGRLVEQDTADESAARGLTAARRYLEDLAGRTGRLRWRASEPIGESEAVGDLPTGWISARINDTGLYINGLAFKPSDWGSEGLPIIRIQNLTDPAKPMSRTKGEFPDEVLVRRGDLLVSWSATLDAFRWNRETGVLNQHIFRVLPATEFTDKGYLLLLLQHAIRAMAEGIHAHGLVMTHINRGPFLAHVVAVPPQAEQLRIVAKVDELMALCDRLEAAQKERESGLDTLVVARLREPSTTSRDDDSTAGEQALLLDLQHVTTRERHFAALRAALRDMAVTGKLAVQRREDETALDLLHGLTRVRRPPEALGSGSRREGVACRGLDFVKPDGWIGVNLGDLTEQVTSGSRGWAEYYSEGGANFVRAQNIRFGRLKLDPMAHVSPPPGSEGSRTQVKVGDLLVVITGAGVTNPALLNVDLGPARK